MTKQKTTTAAQHLEQEQAKMASAIESFVKSRDSDKDSAGCAMMASPVLSDHATELMAVLSDARNEVKQLRGLLFGNDTERGGLKTLHGPLSLEEVLRLAVTEAIELTHELRSLRQRSGRS